MINQICMSVSGIISIVFLAMGVAGIRSMNRLPADPREIEDVPLHYMYYDSASWATMIGFGVGVGFAVLFIVFLIAPLGQ